MFCNSPYKFLKNFKKCWPVWVVFLELNHNEIVVRKVLLVRATLYVSNAKSLPEVDEDWQWSSRVARQARRMRDDDERPSCVLSSSQLNRRFVTLQRFTIHVNTRNRTSLSFAVYQYLELSNNDTCSVMTWSHFMGFWYTGLLQGLYTFSLFT